MKGLKMYKKKSWKKVKMYFSVLWIRIHKDPNLDIKLIKNHKKMSSSIIVTLKAHNYKIFFQKYALNCHANTFKIVGIVKLQIFKVRSETFC
jgi:hypothetical protein